MLLVRGLAVLALCCVVLMPRPAEAKCAYPEPFFVGSADGTVPGNPVLYLFASRSYALTPLKWKPVVHATDRLGLPVAVEIRAVSTTPAFDTYELRASIAAPNRLTVTLGELPRWMAHRKAPTATFQVVKRWQKPSLEPVTVVKTRTEASRWTCSYQRSKNLTPSALAPAYRLEWAESARAFREGQRKSVVLPYNMSLFFQGNRAAPTDALLQLGHVSCQGHTLEFKGRPIWIGLRALYADGSESKAGAKPRRLTPPG